jgi:hypothetical protein
LQRVRLTTVFRQAILQWSAWRFFCAPVLPEGGVLTVGNQAAVRIAAAAACDAAVVKAGCRRIPGLSLQDAPAFLVSIR